MFPFPVLQPIVIQPAHTWFDWLQAIAALVGALFAYWAGMRTARRAEELRLKNERAEREHERKAEIQRAKEHIYDELGRLYAWASDLIASQCGESLILPPTITFADANTHCLRYYYLSRQDVFLELDRKQVHGLSTLINMIFDMRDSAFYNKEGNRGLGFMNILERFNLEEQAGRLCGTLLHDSEASHRNEVAAIQEIYQKHKLDVAVADL
ncbi:MAG: hypothetical protein ACRD1A_12410 [Terriglobales bacterium]